MGLFLHQANPAHKIGNRSSGRKLLLAPQHRGASSRCWCPTQRCWLLTPATFSELLFWARGNCLSQRWLTAHLPLPIARDCDRLMCAHNREALLPLDGPISPREFLLQRSWWDRVQRLLLKPNLCRPCPSFALSCSLPFLPGFS